MDLNDLGVMRNIGISAHIDSGKTTLTERILFYTGKMKDMHEVKGGDGVGAKMDSMELERERGITIQSAATFCRWNSFHMNIIDTPGHIDFTIEVERALKVMDGAVLVICAVGGVQSQSITVDRQMKRYEIPRVVFINKLDRLGSDPLGKIDQIRSQLGLNAALIQLPVGLEDQFQAVVDVITGKMYTFEGYKGMTVVEHPAPEDMQQQIKQTREVLVERLIDVDQELGDAYLEGQTLTPEMIKRAIRRATIQRTFVPVTVGSAFKNKGVQLLLDAIMDYLPDPRQRQNYGLQPVGPDQEERVLLVTDPKAPLVAFAFKLQQTPYGQVTWMRIYQGMLQQGQTLINQQTNQKGRVMRLFRLHADEKEAIHEIGCGEVCAVQGLDCMSGETFGTGNSRLRMSSMLVPDPVLSVGLQLKERDRYEHLMKVLNRYAREDPTFRFTVDPESNQIQISGMGELHLDIYVERMKREENLQLQMSKPYVNYRETIQSRVDFNYLWKKQSGGAGQFARIIGYMEPLPPGSKKTFEFHDKVVGQNITGGFITATGKGFEETMAKGPLLGFPVWGVKVVLQDGGMHVVDSSELAFRLAAQKCFYESFFKASPAILEPVMKLEVTVSSSSMSSILSAINKRDGQITATTTQGHQAIVTANVPLATMFGWSAELRQITQGRGEFTMEYLQHEAVSTQRTNDLLKEFGKSLAELQKRVDAAEAADEKSKKAPKKK
eukprot:TRINITY_DN54339_c0_g1_i1.p1 TRINITY_DN54339_c0_g1~~TRINITY_DN54339_c0_g1_i1.p1  ORF type:complete len:763 (+),score=159.85 TRINITY_DN54339_c0_g1_i1:126-2291(+)